MKKILIFAVFSIIPVTANAGYIRYEMLEPSRVQVGATAYASKYDGIYDASVGEIDVSGSGYWLDLELIGGISRNVNFALGFSPAGEATIESEFLNDTATAETNGVGDTSAELRFRFGRGRTYNILSVGAIVPTGNDDEPVPEIVSNTSVVQPGKAGGRSSGRTDYTVGFGRYFDRGRRSKKEFIGVKYTARGAKDGTDYGDLFTVEVQSTYPLTRNFSFVGSSVVEFTGRTEKASGAYDEQDPWIDFELGGLYSVSQDTEIVAAFRGRIIGGRTYFYDSTGHRYAWAGVNNATRFSLALRTMF